MSSERAARAQARASRINQPNPLIPGREGMEVAGEIPPPAQGEINNYVKYTDPTYFTDMLGRIGLSRACIRQLSTDDFDSMKTLVQQYKGSISAFETYLKSINKSTNNQENPARFSPIMMDRLLAVVHYFIQSVTCFHILPDIEIVDREMAIELIQQYREYKQFNDDDVDDEVLITLPSLKGHENWISYRDKFLSNLAITPGSNGTPLSYIVDPTPRTIKRANQDYIDVDSTNLESWDIYAQNQVHFGPHFRKDNSKVWQLLKRSLLGSQPYHHIDHCLRQENGRRAWESLKSYYEGEDYVNKTVQECLTRVRTMYYRGETPRFNFEKFIDKQKECYKRLRDVGYNNGAGVDEASKCSNLKQMILPEAQLETALSLARTQGLFNGSFDTLVHFLKAEVDELVLRRTQVRANRSHRVSAIGSNRRGGRGGRGRGGRASGRGRYMPRNGRNRSILTRFVDGRQIHSGNYTPDEYRRLTPAQREAVKALRQQARQQNVTHSGDQHNRQVNINAVGVTSNEEEDNLGSASNSTPADTPTSTGGLSSITAPSGGVGSYLGSRRGSRSNGSQA